jgi:hypothetical protein
VKKIEFRSSLIWLRNINCPVILVDPKDVPGWKDYVGNKKFHVTLTPISEQPGAEEPDWKGRAWDILREETNRGFKVNVDLTKNMNEVLDMYEEKARHTPTTPEEKEEGK